MRTAREKRGGELSPPFSTVDLDRDDTLIAGGYAFIGKLLAGKDVPGMVEFDATLLVGEALSNAMKYGHVDGRTVLCQGRVRCEVCEVSDESPSGTTGVLTLLFTYRSTVFNDNPPPAPLTAEGGRGIHLMRDVTAEGGGKAEWRFRQCQPICTVTVVLVKRW